MRIAFLTIASGMFVPIRANFFSSRGHRVYYFGVLPPLKDSKPVGGNFEYIEIKPVANIPYIRQLSTAIKVMRLTRRLRVDILHIIDMVFCLCAPFAKSGRVVIEHNGSDVLINPHRQKILKLLYRFCYRFIDAVIQNSRATQNAGRRYGAPASHNEIISLGVDLNVFNPNIERGSARARLRLADSDRIVFSPRNLTDLYNIDTIIHAASMVKKKIPNVRFVFVGYALDKQEYFEAMARGENLEQTFYFVGQLDRKTELPRFYRDADVVVSVPSSDSFSACVAEAMACGTPVIVSDLPWFKGHFRAGLDLLAVPARDSQALADVVVKVLQKEKTLDTDRISKNVAEKYGVDGENSKLMSLYRHLLRDHA